jgi:hypothetical protein
VVPGRRQSANAAVINGRLTVAFWGLVVMVTFLYAYMLAFTLSAFPMPRDPERYGERTDVLGDSANTIAQMLSILSYPTFQNAPLIVPLTPFYFELVYRPFLAAFQWFGYGCLFGWWLYKRKSRKPYDGVRVSGLEGSIFAK